ncbi:hypothetical protein AB0M02_24995 [Actinoplanes sp. NPDC051861]|uniref:hypothetical protein n=1 Tax=Actinoplanes sp. NPDC051861 TaxID=3155170 RepID=UPI0034335C8E
MQPYPPQPPEPSFFEQEIAGIPVYVHLIAVVVTGGLYLVFMPFVLLFSWIGDQTDRAVSRVVDPLLDRVLKAALVILAVPAYLVFQLVKLIYRRYAGRASRSGGR